MAQVSLTANHNSSTVGAAAAHSRDRRGKLARRSLAEDRSARASILVAYNKSNRSRTFVGRLGLQLGHGGQQRGGAPGHGLT